MTPAISSKIARPVAWTLRLEGLAIAVCAVWAYADTGTGWTFFAALNLVPDLFMLGYLRGPRWGAVLYNLGHTYPVPLALVAMGGVLDLPALIAAALTWIAHIGADRAMGYGLKYAGGFKDTHLGRV